MPKMEPRTMPIRAGLFIEELMPEEGGAGWDEDVGDTEPEGTLAEERPTEDKLATLAVLRTLAEEMLADEVLATLAADMLEIMTDALESADDMDAVEAVDAVESTDADDNDADEREGIAVGERETDVLGVEEGGVAVEDTDAEEVVVMEVGVGVAVGEVVVCELVVRLEAGEVSPPYVQTPFVPRGI